jgi:hypothetical protein
MEVGTMALNQWSKRSLVLVAAICALGGFLAGSSSSQVAPRVLREGEFQGGRDTSATESGRYQMLVGQSKGTYIIFDTATARYWGTSWLVNEKGVAITEPAEWREFASPINKTK